MHAWEWVLVTLAVVALIDTLIVLAVARLTHTPRRVDLTDLHQARTVADILNAAPDSPDEPNKAP